MFMLRKLHVILMVLVVVAVARPAAAELPGSFADLVEKLSPAVVNISTTQKMPARQMPALPFRDLPPGPGFDEFRDFFERFGQVPGEDGNGAEREIYSLGSGFIIDATGYVVTNQHVIADAEEISVTLSDDTKYKAKIVGRDTKTDLALLKIDSKQPLPFVKFGNSDTVRVGDWVVTIGNPFGLGGSVTAGIISARARNINAGPFDDFLQTDAAINRGNSGGPMFNMQGEVVGISSAIFSPSGGNIGIGFAVPSALAQPVIQQLKEYGRTHRGWLGVKIQEVTEEAAESSGLSKSTGALVVDVTKGSPADEAGIKPGDIILSFDGKSIKEMRQLPRLVAETKIGKEVEVVIWRENEKEELDVTLGELKEEETAASTDKEEDKNLDTTKSEELLGMHLSSVTEALREQLGVEDDVKGVVVVDIAEGSEAAKRDIRYGDIIIQVNDSPVVTVQALREALAAAKKAGRKFALIRIQRAGELIFTTLPTEVK